MLGKDPETGLDVTVKAGRFGPYIQLGEQKDYGEDEKPKRAGIPKETSPGDVELELALKLLSLPREIGPHPETGVPITAGIGRFGPFVQARQDLCQPGSRRRGVRCRSQPRGHADRGEGCQGPERRRFGADPGKPLGDHPSRGAVTVKAGRYGAYVTAGGINATIPSDKTPDSITLPEAIALIDERAAKGGGKPKREEGQGRKAAAKAEADGAAPKPAKKAAAKKAASQAEIGRRQQGARAGRIDRQDIGGETERGGEITAPRRAPERHVAK